MTTMRGLQQCSRCGRCCVAGGPVLHQEDLPLIQSGRIARTSLVTLRRGELVLHPYQEKPQPAGVELIKLGGSRGSWTCCHYDQERGCTIYRDRPMACRVLKCWDPGPLLEIIEKDTINRFDILAPDDPLSSVIKEHEGLFPCDFLATCSISIPSSPKKRSEIEGLVNGDLQYRKKMVAQFGLSLEDELFLLGRPLFQNLLLLGIRFSETRGKIQLLWP